MINPLEAIVALVVLIWVMAVWGINSQEDEEGATEDTAGDRAAAERVEREEPPVRDSMIACGSVAGTCGVRCEAGEANGHRGLPTLVDGTMIISGDAHKMIQYLEARYGRRSPSAGRACSTGAQGQDD